MFELRQRECTKLWGRTQERSAETKREEVERGQADTYCRIIRYDRVTQKMGTRNNTHFVKSRNSFLFQIRSPSRRCSVSTGLTDGAPAITRLRAIVIQRSLCGADRYAFMPFSRYHNSCQFLAPQASFGSHSPRHVPNLSPFLHEL